MSGIVLAHPQCTSNLYLKSSIPGNICWKSQKHSKFICPTSN